MRALVYVTAVFSLGISLLSSDIINICYVGGLFYSTSAFLPMVFGLHSKFVTKRAALASIVVTVLLSLGWEYFPQFRPALFSELPSNVFGLVISLILILIISLFDKNGQREKTADI